jgi:hypothetical protein
LPPFLALLFFLDGIISNDSYAVKTPQRVLRSEAFHSCFVIMAGMILDLKCKIQNTEYSSLPVPPTHSIS